MGRLRRLSCAVALVTVVAGASASAASASTLYVNGTTGKDTNACTESSAPCKTIDAAVTKSEILPGTATIEVAAGIYEEGVHLETASDDGIAIVGSGSGSGGTEIVGVSKSPNATVKINLPAGGATLSNLSIVNDSGDEEDGIDASGVVTLNNVAIDMRSATEASGISSGEIGSLTMNGGGVTMESGTKGPAIVARLTPLAVNNASVAILSGSLAGGIYSGDAPLSVQSTSVSLASSAEGLGIAIELGSASLSNDTVTQNGTKSGAAGIGLFLPEVASVEHVTVNMTNPASTTSAVRQALGTARYRQLEVGGTWAGASLQAEGGDITLQDSRLIESPTSTAPALLYSGFGDEPGLFLQRTLVQANPTAAPGALLTINANLTLDSSELLGGLSGVFMQHGASKERRTTIAASTIDAGKPGTADGPSVHDVELGVGGAGSVGAVTIEGSVLLEPQSAGAGPGGNSAAIACSNSDVPNQTQSAKGTEGTIECATGTNGNTSTEPAALFASPITNYQLNPSSSAVDSVPAGTIALPFGLTPSPTDLAGNPRVVDGNGDCIAVQDKGALELQGHSAPCPPAPGGSPPPAKPVAGAITALAISPSAFYAAPSGATITSAKRKYGATISYRDSQTATTTFTVLRLTSGRRQGKSCRRPSKSNQHGKRCTLLSAVGSFTTQRHRGRRRQAALQRPAEGQAAGARLLPPAGRPTQHGGQRRSRQQELHDQVRSRPGAE